MRMVERRPRTHALEFLDTDRDLFGADIICEVGDHIGGHGKTPYIRADRGPTGSKMG